MKSCFLIFSALAMFSSCNQGHKAGSFNAQYIRQPLKEFADSITEMPSGNAIELLAYSGGEEKKKGEGLDYSQFIGIDKTTGDTVRVLAVVINVEDGGEGGKPTLTPATMYDFDKGMRDATFSVPTEEENTLIALMPGFQGGPPDVGKLDSAVQDTAVDGYVLIPEGQPFFTRHYKTVCGILSFKHRPW